MGTDGIRLLADAGLADEKPAKLKVVIMTAVYTAARYRSEAFREFHADDYLSKPVRMAELSTALDALVPPGALTIVGNTGDDALVWGLHVSPDLDSILYALAGLNDA